MLVVLHEIERLGVYGAAVISVADIGTRFSKYDPIEVKAERLMVKYAPGITQPLREFHGDWFAAPRMLEQKLHICPHRRLFADVENEIGLRMHLLALLSIR